MLETSHLPPECRRFWQRDARLGGALRLAARYGLAAALLSCGMANLLRVQGVQIGPLELISPLGHFTPARFLSLWLSAAAPFQMLAGLGEIAAGALLIFRPTRTFGAMLASTILVNAIMLDLCFQTGAALADGGLLGMALYILAPDTRNLIDILLLNRPTMPCSGEPPWPPQSDLNANRVLRLLLLCYCAYTGFALARLRADQASRSALCGIYHAEDFALNGRSLPLDAEVGRRWQMLAVDRYAGALEIRTTDGDIILMESLPSIDLDHYKEGGYRRFTERTKGGRGTLRLRRASQAGSDISRLDYELLAPDRLVLKGEFEGEAIAVRLKRVDKNAFPFVNHAIWAYPF